MNTEQIATILDAAILSEAQRQGVKPREVATKAVVEDILATLAKAYVTGTRSIADEVEPSFEKGN